MFRSTFACLAPCVLVALALAACGDDPTEPETDYLLSVQPGNGKATAASASGFDPEIVAALAARIDAFNAAQEAAGSSLRLDYPWMFVVGGGTDPFAQLRTGSRWNITTPTFILDESDFTTDLASGDVEATLLASLQTWEAVDQTFIGVERQPDGGGNFDVLDGIIRDLAGDCVEVFDLTSPNLLSAPPGPIIIDTAADIVMGGWLDPVYFEDCLGSAAILGVTWFFSGGDTDGDQYADLQYVEQFYNEDFRWVTSGSVFRDGGSGVDLQSVAAHENGHALGLGHFGGPVRSQPFRLKRNGRVFNPEAVMNPFYLFGEKRDLRVTDEAALRTLYARTP